MPGTDKKPLTNGQAFLLCLAFYLATLVLTVVFWQNRCLCLAGESACVALLVWLRRRFVPLEFARPRPAALPCLAAVAAGIGYSVFAGGVVALIEIAWPTPEVYGPVGGPYWAVLLQGCVAAPILEELQYRGILFETLRRNLPLKKAMAVSALAFAIVHLNVYQMGHAFAFGLAAAWLYYQTETLLYPMLLHITANLGSGAASALSAKLIAVWHAPLAGACMAAVGLALLLAFTILCANAAAENGK